MKKRKLRRLTGSDAAVVAELKRLAAETGGVLRPEQIVQAAEPEDSPLHSKFTWDDSEAAQSFRIEQARRLLRVTIHYIVSGRKTWRDRVFVSLSTDRDYEADTAGYRVMVNVLSRADLRQQLLEDAISEMRVFQEKYGRLKELAEVFAAMKRIRKGKK